MRIAGIAGAPSLLGIVTWCALTIAGPTARCPVGLTSLGSRCCGEGQRVDSEGRCTGEPHRCSHGLRLTPAGCIGENDQVSLAGGLLRLAPSDWEAQGTVRSYEAWVPGFHLDRLEVNEARYTQCVLAGSCPQLPLRGEPGIPVTSITLDEAQKFCHFAGGALPSREQFVLAASGLSGRRYPWGDTGAVCRRASYGLRDGPCARGTSGPELTGARPDGASPEGVLDLAGNVAEWTIVTGASTSAGHVVGGSWMDESATALRTWHVRSVEATTRSDDIGFRCAYAAR
ncbi:uncharacterized protein CMC5_005460 [Chondromyces crocatus]|uniref:Sulfatase-modifying factor enzyme-like domain-containing protein n=2 Tax=Chondromyces crocatus TaxID=52 RepID=A0A0K1E779_CHOCO|nr:SUMF1/EgtB/PvdO family nonheme iron enzyme [Chondromyces crocatus]AKT36433.1 uncharacterized protein CMC5_005460 [Chondromyces crocatus]